MVKREHGHHDHRDDHHHDRAHDPAANADFHRELAEQAEHVESVKCAVITVSDSRDVSEDESGSLIQRLLKQEGHTVLHYDLLPNEPQRIESKLEELLSIEELQFAVFTGGTGLGPRDLTVDTLRSHFEKVIDGFGELFRFLSYEEIGPAAMMSRADAGIVQGMVIVSLPGSKNAVRLAMNKILLPELRHLVNELTRVGHGC